jgi:hypothetical protein
VVSMSYPPICSRRVRVPGTSLPPSHRFRMKPKLAASSCTMDDNGKLPHQHGSLMMWQDGSHVRNAPLPATDPAFYRRSGSKPVAPALADNGNLWPITGD